MYSNYSSNIIDVYTEAALKVETTHELDSLLCSVDHAQPAPSQPSWVPDWSAPRQTVSLGYSAKDHKVYQTSKEREMRSRTEITENGTALAITGVIIDTITTVGMVLEVPDLKDILVPESLTCRFILKAIHIALEFCQPHPSPVGPFSKHSGKHWSLGGIIRLSRKHHMNTHQSLPFFSTRLQGPRRLFPTNQHFQPSEGLPLRI